MKQKIVLGVIILVGGAILRLSSYALSWPGNCSYSGPREATQWAIQEAALNDIAMGIFYLGGSILIGLLLMNHWKKYIEKI